jgi:hypothetical protein
MISPAFKQRLVQFLDDLSGDQPLILLILLTVLTLVVLVALFFGGKPFRRRVGTTRRRR